MRKAVTAIRGVQEEGQALQSTEAMCGGLQQKGQHVLQKTEPGQHYSKWSPEVQQHAQLGDTDKQRSGEAVWIEDTRTVKLKCHFDWREHALERLRLQYRSSC